MYWLPFSIGLIGSLHCIGMCGPLMASFLPFAGPGNGFRSLLYHLGRITAYAIIGLMMGLLGKSFIFLGVQQYISFVLGFLIVFFVVVQYFTKYDIIGKSKLVMLFTNQIKKIQLYIYQNPGLRKTFLFGFANGIMPCGLVYLAVAGAVAQYSVFLGGSYMILFGLGTLPMLFTFTFISAKIKSLKYSIKPLSVIVTIIAGIVLMHRGLQDIKMETPNLNKIVHFCI